MARREKSDVTEKAAVETVVLKNISKRPLIFHLTHAAYCGEGPCSCDTKEHLVQEYNHRTQEHTPKVIERRVCTSLSFLINETKTVDPRVLSVPDISAAIDSTLRRL